MTQVLQAEKIDREPGHTGGLLDQLVAAFLAALLPGAVLERVKTSSLTVVALVFGALIM